MANRVALVHGSRPVRRDCCECLAPVLRSIQWKVRSESEILARPLDALQVALIFEFDLRLGA
jgi:hypothetical protein